MAITVFPVILTRWSLDVITGLIAPRWSPRTLLKFLMMILVVQKLPCCRRGSRRRASIGPSGSINCFFLKLGGVPIFLIRNLIPFLFRKQRVGRWDTVSLLIIMVFGVPRFRRRGKSVIDRGSVSFRLTTLITLSLFMKPRRTWETRRFLLLMLLIVLKLRVTS